MRLNSILLVTMIFVRLIAKVMIFLCQGAPAKDVFVLSPWKCPIHIPLVFITVALKQCTASQQSQALYEKIACHLDRKYRLLVTRKTGR